MKSSEIENVILNLLLSEKEISVRLVAAAIGVSKDDTSVRKSIQRALRSLEIKNLISPVGAGRSRVYVAPEKSEEIPASSKRLVDSFAGISLAAESQSLLDFLSLDLKQRPPIGYVQEFLSSYEPNRTFYLSIEQRAELHAVGQVEAIQRPAGTYARNILNRLLIDLSWNSSRLEGNTYSLLETKRLIELGETADGKNAAEAQMILNHKAAIEYIVEFSGDELITAHDICSIHALLSENLLGDPAASGRVRTLIVGITGTNYVPIENPHSLRECFDLFVQKLNAIADPFEQSLFSIIHLSYLQTFEDVNKRTARIVANVPLIKKNLKPLSFVEVDQSAYVTALLGVYERNDINLIRDLYIWSFKRSAQRYTAIQQSMGEPNLMKLRYRLMIQEIIRTIIIEKVAGSNAVRRIKGLMEDREIAASDREAVFHLIETEIINLHEGNAARFKVRPSEFQGWLKSQSAKKSDL